MKRLAQASPQLSQLRVQALASASSAISRSMAHAIEYCQKRLFLDTNLRGRVDNDFRYFSMAGYFSTHADVLVAVGTLWVSEFWSVRPPNHHCKYLLRIWHIEIHKRGKTFGFLSKMSASNSSADCSGLAQVIFSFCRS